MQLNCPVSLVIPMLNEASTLPELLLAISEQSCLPDEIIFCDAGSIDEGPELIKSWWEQNAWDGGNCRVLIIPGAMPGAGRNAGIRAARNDLIAFVDAGIKPDSSWLHYLYYSVASRKTFAIFGVCYFLACTPFSKAICALSYGCGSLHPVIPASIFSRQVFDVIGFFPEYLRAGEDIVWMKKFLKVYGKREVCMEARVNYAHFPVGWKQAISKWFITETHCVLAGVRSFQHFVYLLGLPVIFYALCFKGLTGFLIFCVYLIWRGVIDPVRRSADHPWWGRSFKTMLVAVPIALILDVAKWIGIIYGISIKFGNSLRLRGCNSV